MSADLTVALNAHSETVVAGPTMSSAEAAIAAAEAAGLTVERIIGLDRVSDGARAFFEQPAFDSWRRLELDCGDLGLSRNALAEAATGEIVAFLDADDLFSENWLSDGAAVLRAAAAGRDPRGERLILHPEVNWFFDAARSVLVNPDQGSEFYTPLYWQMANYYDSLAMAPRTAFLEVPYAGRDKERGLGFEDWRWNIETIEAGWRHMTVPDTIIFKRRRDDSLVTQLGASRSVLWDLDALRIDRLETL
ncbi:glycosyltransferase family A protein [Roseisalinus antarcticus]|uniref:Glycosyltransferase 2-like domain-containing protein n=1 Tax=Roseisalinus antarcticus TaxID=254357 RepID=A0A1Y5TQ70_9RHOB|nr:glycosyltransferase family A protein [Roseisalinus antarcticus]SLN68949.1 hypothetical protein ROA7023_03342 [Roseisalinus antarcticus]